MCPHTFHNSECAKKSIRAIINFVPARLFCNYYTSTESVLPGRRCAEPAAL